MYILNRGVSKDTICHIGNFSANEKAHPKLTPPSCFLVLNLCVFAYTLTQKPILPSSTDVIATQLTLD